MSSFWSGWVKFLVMLNLGITLFLFLWAQRIKIPTQPDGTTGHVWAHGVLRESVRKLPLWWVIASAATFLFGFVYLTLYPGFGSFAGVLGWTSTGELARDVAANQARLEASFAPLRGQSIEQLATNATAVRLGERLYQDNCAACHGREAQGNQSLGAPNLVDDDWLYGAGTESLLHSIRHGRTGIMPPLGVALGRDGVNETAAYTLSLSGVKAPADWVEAGKARFDALCVACHAADGRGNPALGAPNLTDNIWLYGNDFATVAATIRDGRTGTMPAWSDRLSDDEVRVIAAWVTAQSAAHRARSGS